MSPARLALVAVLGVFALTVVIGAEPAGADPARPTDYRSTVDGVVPATDAIEVRVVGGDAFLAITVDAGHEVTVSGYQNEPYLRVLSDGTVERNRRSPATSLNETRFGSDVGDTDPDAEPDWETVATGGVYAWHDHRIHWMTRSPPSTPPGTPVIEWTVPLVVDGQAVEVQGTLIREPPVNPLPWIAAALILAAALIWLGWRSESRTAIGLAVIAALLASIIAVTLAIIERSDTPPGAGGAPLPLAVSVVALVMAAAGALLWVRRRPHPAGLAAAGSLALLAGWILLRLPSLWKPVLPTPVAGALERAGIASVIGLVIGATILLIRSGGGRPSRPQASGIAARPDNVTSTHGHT